jgi:hypothetical protein
LVCRFTAQSFFTQQVPILVITVVYITLLYQRLKFSAWHPALLVRIPGLLVKPVPLHLPQNLVLRQCTKIT